MFLLCFAVLVAATSAATVCKCEDKKVPNMREQLYSSTLIPFMYYAGCGYMLRLFLKSSSTSKRIGFP